MRVHVREQFFPISLGTASGLRWTYLSTCREENNTEVTVCARDWCERVLCLSHTWSLPDLQ